MINRTQLSKEAYYSSIKVRKNLGIQLNVPITISDTIEKYGIELRFIDTKSIEGLYSKDPGPLILIGAYRPKGRQVFTCAHEFAHHVFEHGSHFDEIKENLYRDSEEEFLADSFAGYFLMPPSAINIIMKKKEWNYNKLTPFQILYLSNYFKVGYITMIDHLFYSLRLITYDKAKEFKNTQKKEIYIDFLKMEINSDLLVIDDCFQNNIDLTIADYIFDFRKRFRNR
jgi:Zn-dependent peptidase ImmA (M78 family)